MLEVLRKLSNEMDSLLKEKDQWFSADLGRIKQVWRPWGDYHIRLNKIGPCGPDEIDYHQRRKQFAGIIVRGMCEIGVGFAEISVSHRSVAQSGHCYEVTDPKAWYYIRPLSETYEVVVTEPDPENPFRLHAQYLDPEDKEDILFTFTYHLERWPIRVPRLK